MVFKTFHKHLCNKTMKEREQASERIYKTVDELIGKTPLLELANIEIVTLLPDTGDRYLSTALFTEE